MERKSNHDDRQVDQSVTKEYCQTGEYHHIQVSRKAAKETIVMMKHVWRKTSELDVSELMSDEDYRINHCS